MNTWYVVYASGWKYNSKNERMGRLPRRKIAEFYIPSHADRFVEWVNQQHPTWLITRTERAR